MKKFVLAIGLGVVFFSCASEEARVKKKTYFGGEQINIDQLSYFELTTGEEISLARYMDENKLENVFLIFGSVGCVKCNAKAKVLSHELFGKHSLFLDSAKYRFEMIGVNTDVGSARRRFDQIWQDEATKKQAGYDFVKWSDPGAETVKSQLMESGSTFAIPFMVLLNRNSLLARYNANDPRAIDVVLDDVKAVLEGRGPSTPPPPGPGDEENPDNDGEIDQPTVKFPAGTLALEGRFKEIGGYDCRTQQAMGISQTFTGKGYRYIHLGAEQCNVSCQVNRALFAGELKTHCQDGKKCSVIDYQYDASGAVNCANKHEFFAKTDLRAVFRTALNWRPDLVTFNSWGEPDTLKEDDNSYVLVFDANDQLVYAKSGPTSIHEITNPTPNRSYVPTFKLLGAADQAMPPQTRTLRNLLAETKYTIFYEYGPGCESCDKKLVKWSKVDADHPGLLQFCRESQGFCALYALKVPIPGLNTPATAYVNTLQHMRENGATVPLLVDEDTIQENTNADTYARFFEGYLKPQYRTEWADEFGGVLNGATVIYDSEGKIVMSFAPSADPNAKDKVAEAVKSLWLYHQRR